VYLSPPQGVTSSKFREDFDAGKTRMVGLPYGEKNYDDMLSRFHTIPACHGRTDRRTDRQTDRQNCYMNIARQCADAR